MLFSSPIFVFAFLPLVYLLNLKMPVKISNVFLTMASLLFYAWGEPVYILLLIASVTVNYYAALLIARSNKYKKTIFIISLIFNIGLLVIFKYTGFLLGTITGLMQLNYEVPAIALPLGISFFTFQIMSYVIDVYMGRVEVQRSYLKLMLYISFFPQLVAGPIVKYKDIEDRLKSRKVTIEGTAAGIKRFIIGLSKKLLIANTFALPADKIFALQGNELNIAIAWIGAISYLIQIYFDFSGYSDMAIGMGKMFGFDFLENFNYPYVASSVQEFWKRWHISLSSWFKEYLYIPLGGNRKGKVRTSINRITVFFFTGLWHGADFTFIVWGLYHGFFLMMETFGMVKPKSWPRALRHTYTLLVVTVGFVIFRAESMAQVGFFMKNMFSGFTFRESTRATVGLLLNPLIISSFIIALIFSMPVLPWLRGKIEASTRFRILKDAICAAACLGLYILCMLNLSSSSYNPFIYFRF